MRMTIACLPANPLSSMDRLQFRDCPEVTSSSDYSWADCGLALSCWVSPNQQRHSKRRASVCSSLPQIYADRVSTPLRRSDARTVLLDRELRVAHFDPNLIFQLLHMHLRLA